MLHGALMDSAVLDTQFGEKAAVFESNIITLVGREATTLSNTVGNQFTLLANLTNVTDALETLVRTVASQLQLSSELLAETEKAVSYYTTTLDVFSGGFDLLIHLSSLN